MSGPSRVSPRADVVGSLLRPPELLEARRNLSRSRITAAAFKRIEDRAVDAAVRIQEEVGLDVATDGEMRRSSFQSPMTAAVEGFSEHGLDAFLWGEWRSEELGDWRVARPPLSVVAKLRPRRHLCAEELTYLRARTTRIAKVSLPSPTLFVNFWSAARNDAYASRGEFLADVAAVLREEIAELARLGATYVQIDAPHYTSLVDPAQRDFYLAGESLTRWLERAIELENAVIEGFPEVTFGFHLCRGNQNSRWLSRGGYEPIARALFRGIAAQRLLLEYDDERSGSFEPLQEVPEDKTVVLGLVSTKSPRLEDGDLLRERIEEAARFVSKERLALSPQCGFSTSIVGNRLSFEDQRRKLALVVETARAVWG